MAHAHVSPFQERRQRGCDTTDDRCQTCNRREPPRRYKLSLRWGGPLRPQPGRATTASEGSGVGWSGRVGHGERDRPGLALDGPGEQQPGPADLGPVAQPPTAVLPAGQPLTLEAAGGHGGVLAGDRQGGPVLAGAAAAAEAQHAVVDAPEGHAVAAGPGLGLHQHRTVGQHPGVVPFLDRTDFRGQAVQAVPLIDVEHFFHACITGEGKTVRMNSAAPRRLEHQSPTGRCRSWCSSSDGRTSMAHCVTCGVELHPERAERYDYCPRRECREENAKPLTIAAVAVNKAADQYLVLNDQAKEDLAAGKYQGQRKSSSVTDGPRHKRARTPSPPPKAPP